MKQRRILSLALCCLLGSQIAVAHSLPTAPAFSQGAWQTLAALDLSPSQRMQLLRIAQQAQSEHQRLRSEQDQLLIEADAALHAGQADLRALTASQQALTDQRIQALRALRDELLAFYDGMDADQQANTQHWLWQQVQRIERLRATLDDLRSGWPLQP